MLDKIYDDDIVIVCKNCGKEFVFTKGEQAFYKEKGFNEPKRCFDCRKHKHNKIDKIEVVLPLEELWDKVNSLALGGVIKEVK